jgi:hypothetical protein
MRGWIATGVLLAACSSSDDDLLLDEGTGGPEGSAVEARGWFAPLPGDLSACSAAYELVGGDGCARTERALGEGDAGALGFEAGAFLQLISGEFRSALTWSAGAPGPTDLVLGVQPRGDVRYVAREYRYPRDARFIISNNGTRYLECGDRLAVDAEVSIVSADGALNEVIDAVVEADSAGYAKITAASTRDALVGHVLDSAQPGDAERRFDDVTFTFGVSPFGLEASVAAHPRFVESDLDTQQCTELATNRLSACSPWGAVSIAPGDEVVGLSFEGAIALANAASPVTLDSGAELTLTFEASPEPSCVGIDTPALLPHILQFPARVQLGSSDGRVGGAMDVQVTAEASGGTLRRVTAGASTLSPASDDPLADARRFAILEPLVWAEGEVVGFEFFSQSGEGGARGILRANGSILGCEGTRPCEEVCPGPGCTSTLAEKWAVRWGAPVIGEDESLLY